MVFFHEGILPATLVAYAILAHAFMTQPPLSILKCPWPRCVWGIHARAMSLCERHYQLDGAQVADPPDGRHTAEETSAQ